MLKECLEVARIKVIADKSVGVITLGSEIE
jgi:hypothetical protein